MMYILRYGDLNRYQASKYLTRLLGTGLESRARFMLLRWGVGLGLGSLVRELRRAYQPADVKSAYCRVLRLKRMRPGVAVH